MQQFCFLTTVALLIEIAGCGRGGPEMVPISGKVTFQGQPVANGRIRFIPSDGTAGPVSGSRIENGQYQITNKGGVPIGKHRVEIEAFMQHGAGADVEQIPGAGSVEGYVQYVPPKYNKNSTLSVNIEPNSGGSALDFHLTK